MSKGGNIRFISNKSWLSCLVLPRQYLETLPKKIHFPLRFPTTILENPLHTQPYYICNKNLTSNKEAIDKAKVAAVVRYISLESISWVFYFQCSCKICQHYWRSDLEVSKSDYYSDVKDIYEWYWPIFDENPYPYNEIKQSIWQQYFLISDKDVL